MRETTRGAMRAPLSPLAGGTPDRAGAGRGEV